MTQEWNEGPRPAPEELMAFADGELDTGRQEEVAYWLAVDPSARGEVEQYRRLSHLWKSVAAPEPTPSAWRAALERIESAGPAGRTLPGLHPRRPLWTFSGLAAAAVLGFVLLGRLLAPVPVPPAGDGPAALEDEVLPVAQVHEINIVRMDARDADALVGHPALSDALEFVAAGDVRLVGAEPHAADGRVPRMADGPVPLILTGAAPNRKDR